MNENEVDAFLEHHGIKGMKWGIRNDPTSSGFRLQTIDPKIDSSLDSSTKTAGKEVSRLMAQRYGFQITEIRNLKTGRPDEYNRGTAAFVENTPGKSGGVIFAKPGNITKELEAPDNAGWMAKGTDNVRGLLTHESAHALFHAQQSTKAGLFSVKVVGGEQSARDKAMKASVKQAKRDGIRSDFLSKISDYAAFSGTREEAEAEMFSQYHWGSNTPAFINVWGKTLHQEMGIDSTPFKDQVKRHG